MELISNCSPGEMETQSWCNYYTSQESFPFTIAFLLPVFVPKVLYKVAVWKDRDFNKGVQKGFHHKVLNVSTLSRLYLMCGLPIWSLYLRRKHGPSRHLIVSIQESFFTSQQESLYICVCYMICSMDCILS